MQMPQSIEEGEFMSLAPDVGIIPAKFRNRAYSKLEFGPGEGGLGDMRKAHERGGADDRVEAFLAGVAAGADPKELAQNLMKPTGRRAQKGA